VPVNVSQRERVAVVTLDRPEKRNAMDAEMTTALDGALNRLDDDAGVRAIVLASSSHVFSAGTDLATGSGGPTGRGGPYGITRRTRRTPLVAAVEGPALGGGFEIVLACDLVVASSAASFGLPEVSRGVVATCGGLFRGPRALALNVATELLLTGDPIGSQRAVELGLVNRLTNPGGALDEALTLAGRIAQNSPVAVQATLRSIHAHVGALNHLGWLSTDDATRAVLASPDAAEGKRAFLERRAPVWHDPVPATEGGTPP
jgi:enoyl-CoA hydratase